MSAAEHESRGREERAHNGEAAPQGGFLREVPDEVRDVSFSAAVRGYDRHEVDAYVERVQEVIAGLELSRSPHAAVKHALDQLGAQASAILAQARQVSEQLTATAVAESDHLTRRAKVEAEETLDAARARAQELRDGAREASERTLATVERQARERVAYAERQARSAEEEGRARLKELEQQIALATAARSSLLGELRKLSAELRELADGAMARAREAQSDADDGGQETVETAAPAQPRFARRQASEPPAADEQATRELPAAER